jgi:hypothetical protein
MNSGWIIGGFVLGVVRWGHSVGLNSQFLLVRPESSPLGARSLRVSPIDQNVTGAVIFDEITRAN